MASSPKKIKKVSSTHVVSYWPKIGAVGKTADKLTEEDLKSNAVQKELRGIYRALTKENQPCPCLKNNLLSKISVDHIIQHTSSAITIWPLVCDGWRIDVSVLDRIPNVQDNFSSEPTFKAFYGEKVDTTYHKPKCLVCGSHFGSPANVKKHLEERHKKEYNVFSTKPVTSAECTRQVDEFLERHKKIQSKTFLLWAAAYGVNVENPCFETVPKDAFYRLEDLIGNIMIFSKNKSTSFVNQVIEHFPEGALDRIFLKIKQTSKLHNLDFAEGPLLTFLQYQQLILKEILKSRLLQGDEMTFNILEQMSRFSAFWTTALYTLPSKPSRQVFQCCLDYLDHSEIDSEKQDHLLTFTSQFIPKATKLQARQFLIRAPPNFWTPSVVKKIPKRFRDSLIHILEEKGVLPYIIRPNDLTDGDIIYCFRRRIDVDILIDLVKKNPCFVPTLECVEIACEMTLEGDQRPWILELVKRMNT